MLYSPLDISKSEFRLIRHVGSTDDTSWECKTFGIHSNVPWTALSYRWGTADATKFIILNGEEFAVRPNLYSFLVQMADEDRHDWFFVDAICIDQSNLAERSSQVALMGDVYLNAQKTIVWIKFERGQGDWNHDRFGTSTFEQFLLQNLAEASKTPQLMDRFTELVLLAIIRDEYWTRLWIIQEILLSREVVVRWHTITITMDRLLELCLAKYRSSGFLRPDGRANPGASQKFEADGGFSCVQLLYRKQIAGAEIRAGRLLAFHEAVEFFSLHNCHEARDSIFGLLGITRNAIVPSYETSMTELYTAALFSGLSSYGSLYQWSSDLDEHRIPKDRSEELASLGHALISGLRVDPFSDLIFFITTHVCQRFSRVESSPMLTKLLLLSKLYMAWFYDQESAGTDADNEVKLLVNRPDETKDEAEDRVHDNLMRHLLQAHARRETLEREDGAFAGGGKEMQYSEWVQLADTICDDISSRLSTMRMGAGRQTSLTHELGPDPPA